MTKTIKITGMNCGHCAAAVTKELKRLDGVANVEVNLEAKQAVVELSGSVSDAMLAAAVDEAGFEVVEIL